jgi:hypothetical protein
MLPCNLREEINDDDDDDNEYKNTEDLSAIIDLY